MLAGTGFYVWNNAGIAILTFGVGILGGILSLTMVLFNAVFLGAIMGYLLTTPAAANILSWIPGHGPFELTAIAFAGAAGLRVGFSFVAPEGRRRLRALREEAAAAVPVLVASVSMLFIAAFLEADARAGGSAAFVEIRGRRRDDSFDAGLFRNLRRDPSGPSSAGRGVEQSFGRPRRRSQSGGRRRLDVRNIQYRLRRRRLDEIFDFATLVLRNHLASFLMLVAPIVGLCFALNAGLIAWLGRYGPDELEWLSWPHLGLLLLLMFQRSVVSLPVLLLNGNLFI